MISIIPAIKTLRIRNYGMVRKVDFKFTKGFNIIYGVCGSGKTTVVNAIRHLVNGEKLIYGPNKYMKPSEKALIEVELLRKSLGTEVREQVSVYKQCLRKGTFPDGRKIPAGMLLTENLEGFKNTLSYGEKTFFEVAETLMRSNKGQAILLDDIFGRLDKEHRKIVFELLKKSKLQVIMTLSYHEELVKGANVIKLKFVKRDGKPAVYS